MITIVRLITTMESQVATRHLQMLKDHDVITMLAYCLRSNNSELIYWSVGLLHEFTVKDVGREDLVTIKGLARILLAFLNTLDESYVIRIVLRVMKLLSQKKGLYNPNRPPNNDSCELQMSLPL